MNGKLLSLILCLYLLSVGSLAVEREGTNRGYKDFQDADVSAEAGLQNGEAFRDETKLDPRLQAVVDRFDKQISAIETQTELAASQEQFERLQSEIRELKSTELIELANVQLEIARETGNSELEQELIRKLDRLQNPPARIRNGEARSEVEGAER